VNSDKYGMVICIYLLYNFIYLFYLLYIKKKHIFYYYKIYKKKHILLLFYYYKINNQINSLILNYKITIYKIKLELMKLYEAYYICCA